MVASPVDEDVFIAIEDLSQGMLGKEVDGTRAGPHNDPDYGPDEHVICALRPYEAVRTKRGLPKR